MTPERMQQIEAIFHNACDLAPGERAAFIAQACAGDEDLRREVELLLESDEQAATLIEAPAYQMAAPLLVENQPSSFAGKSISHYQIISLLGKGGMGEVYRARDTKLDRTVALKILPADVATDAERMRRFVSEAKAASALNHPHVATIYEIGEAENASFIAMEFVEGQTLTAKINGTPLPIREVVEIGIQIADALDEAHSKGITHRDIKPANVMLTARGQVKVLDFGLAKIAHPQSIDSNISTLAKTASGIVMGTVPYMSPEQALGRDVDYRSDIFSLGIVLYEMATGRLPFAGASASETLDRILHSQPDAMARFNYDVPGELERIVRKCLEKERERRYQSARELLIDLKNLKRDSEATAPLSVQSVGLASRFKRHRLSAGMIFLAAVAGLAFGLYRLREQNPPADRVSGPAPRVVPFTSFPGNECCPTFSPDGNQIAFVWDGGKGNDADIYVKLIDAESPMQLTTNPAADTAPAWSPDGRHIAFIRSGKNEQGIFLITALGGAERALYTPPSADADIASDLAWSPDGKLLAFSERGSPQEPYSIFLLSLESLEKTRLTSLPAGSYGDYSPAFSPDGKTLAFKRAIISKFYGQVYFVPITGGEPQRLTEEVTAGIRPHGLAWTPDGRAVVSTKSRELWKIPVAGAAPERIAAVGDKVFAPAIARQGNRLAYTQYSWDENIWRFEVSNSSGRTSAPTRLIASTFYDSSPRYSPDGKKIVFKSNRSGNSEIYVCESDGSNLNKLTSFNGPDNGSPRWSPDGRQIAFDGMAEGNWDIYVINASGGKPRRLTAEATAEVRPSWSHDGQWIYFGSNRSGTWQIWKMPAGGSSAVQVTQQGGFEAFESADGKTLYYTNRFDLNSTSLWQMPVTGGTESQVLERVHQGYWAVLEQGIYFLNAQANPPSTIEFFSFATNRSTQLAVIEKEVTLPVPGFAVSPDGRWLLLTLMDHYQSDIMLLESFR
ncbi:MAG: serine/threonine-protein kinase [Acidobacteria bacterium]|nr:serine/threonine-protein kinase [Acidobacteriota bacterium]